MEVRGKVRGQRRPELLIPPPSNRRRRHRHRRRAGVGERQRLPAPTVGARRRLLLPQVAVPEPLLPLQHRLLVFLSGLDRSRAGFANNEPLVQVVRIRALVGHLDLRSRGENCMICAGSDV